MNIINNNVILWDKLSNYIENNSKTKTLKQNYF